MSVTLSIGPQPKPFPWRFHDKPPADNKPRLVLCRSTTQAARIRPRLGFQSGFNWKVIHTTNGLIKNVRVIAWHVNDEVPDYDRAVKAAVWVEKEFGLCKTLKVELEWFEEFRKAWETKAWA